MQLRHVLLAGAFTTMVACQKDDNPDNTPIPNETISFTEVGSIDIGDIGAAEISAYDSLTKRLFVVNNGGTNKIDVIDFKDPSQMKVIASINVSAFGAVNSVAVHDGMLAAAIEAVNKQEPGRVVVYRTSDYSPIKSIQVGALPDMISFSPDGNYILIANEGEPSADYSNDPEGSVSIIEVKNGFNATHVNFAAFAGQQAALQQKGLRVFGLNTTFAKDMEPEYITVAPDSKTAWVTLQENNAIAKIDLGSKTVSAIFPLGFKNYQTAANAIDVSDKDDVTAMNPQPVKGMYQPDAIAVLLNGGIPYLFTANEGDVREYNAFNEAKRIKSLKLDPVAFPNAAALQQDAALGRLNATTTLGDKDGDGDYDELYNFGARSFSIWNGNDGALVFDSKNELETKCITAGVYDDGRSDDKGVEPEGITIGTVGNKHLAFVGMERSDAVAVYDITNPVSPVFLQLLKCGDAPEGVLFIPEKGSPGGKSLLVVSSENDGVVKVYEAKKR